MFHIVCVCVCIRAGVCVAICLAAVYLLRTPSRLGLFCSSPKTQKRLNLRLYLCH